jgi:hypothetical protein
LDVHGGGFSSSFSGHGNGAGRWRMVFVLGWMAALGQMLVFRAVAGVSGR